MIDSGARRSLEKGDHDVAVRNFQCDLLEKLRSALQHVVIEAAELSLILKSLDLSGARQ